MLSYENGIVWHEPSAHTQLTDFFFFVPGPPRYKRSSHVGIIVRRVIVGKVVTKS